MRIKKKKSKKEGRKVKRDVSLGSHGEALVRLRASHD